MNTNNPDGILAIFPEWRPYKWWSLKKGGRMVWTVEICRPDFSSSGPDFYKYHKHFHDPDLALACFDRWTLKYPKADTQILGFTHRQGTRD